MAYYLSNLMQDAYRKMGMLNVSIATGGSDTTIVDSKLAAVGKDDAWKESVMFIVRDSSGVAPENEFNRISAYDAASGTFTVDTAFTAAVASGDTYAYTTPEIKLREMIELANASIQSLGASRWLTQPRWTRLPRRRSMPVLWRGSTGPQFG